MDSCEYEVRTGWQIVTTIGMAVVLLGWMFLMGRGCTEAEYRYKSETDKARIEKGCPEVKCP